MRFILCLLIIKITCGKAFFKFFFCCLDTFPCIHKPLLLFPNHLENRHYTASANNKAKLFFNNTGALSCIHQIGFRVRGIMIDPVNKKISTLYNIQFSLRKYSIYKSDISFINVIKQLANGRRDYLNKINKFRV